MALHNPKGHYSYKFSTKAVVTYKWYLPAIYTQQYTIKMKLLHTMSKINTISVKAIHSTYKLLLLNRCSCCAVERSRLSSYKKNGRVRKIASHPAKRLPVDSGAGISHA